MSEIAILSQNEKFRKYLDAKIIADTKDMPKEEWLKHRQAGIGGSDIWIKKKKIQKNLKV